MRAKKMVFLIHITLSISMRSSVPHEIEVTVGRRAIDRHGLVGAGERGWGAGRCPTTMNLCYTGARSELPVVVATYAVWNLNKESRRHPCKYFAGKLLKRRPTYHTVLGGAAERVTMASPLLNGFSASLTSSVFYV